MSGGRQDKSHDGGGCRGRAPVSDTHEPPPTRDGWAAVRVGGPGGQLTSSAVSSMTNDVWSWEPSVPVNFTVTVCPAYAPRSKVRVV